MFYSKKTKLHKRTSKKNVEPTGHAIFSRGHLIYFTDFLKKKSLK